MNELSTMDCDLLILPDASSNDYSQHKVLKDKGIDIIVLDHHMADKYSPYACVVNNQLSKNISNKTLTGVGVVYKFCKWIDNELKLNIADNYLDVFALGMIGDSANLTNLESRYLVLKGLKLIEDKTNQNKLISAIYKLKAYGMSNKVTPLSTAFYMCPTVNCIIRGGDKSTKELLFKAFVGSDERFEDKVRGKGIVEMSIEDYILRLYGKLKKQQDSQAEQGVELMKKQIDQFNMNDMEILILNGTEIEDKTYTRLIVNRISDRYKKHTLILSSTPKGLSGSGSAAKNKEISDFRLWCANTGLFKFAHGHPGAFGCLIDNWNINKLYDIVKSIPSSNILNYIVDDVFNDKSLNEYTVKLVGQCDDVWGNSVEEPMFAMENIKMNKEDLKLIGKQKTTFTFNYHNIDFIKFKFSEDEYNKLIESDCVELTIVGRFKTNEYNGEKKAQIVIENYMFIPCSKVNTFNF